MKNSLLLLVLFGSLFSSAQKTKLDVKYDRDSSMVSIDGVRSFKMEKIDCGFGMVDCHFDVFDLEGNKLIRINFRSFKSPVEVSKYNKDGTVSYYEFIFLESKQKAEIAFMSINSEKLARSILSNKLMVDGKLNHSAVEEFILVNGTPFSDRVKF